MSRAGRVVAGIVGACVVVAGVYGAVFLYGQHEARAEIDAALAALPPGTTAQYQWARMSPLTWTVEIDGLTVARNGQPTARFGSVRLREADGDGSAAHPWRVGALHLRDVSLMRRQGTVTLDRMDGEDLVALAPRPAGTPVHGVERFYQPDGEARLVSARRIEGDGIADNDGRVATVVLNDLAPGRLGAIRLEGASAGGGSLRHFAMSGIALADLDAVFDPTAYPNGQPAWTDDRPLIGHLEMADFTAASTLGTARFDSLAADGLRGHPATGDGAGAPIGMLRGLTETRSDLRNLVLIKGPDPAGLRVSLASVHEETRPGPGGSLIRHGELRGAAVPLTTLPAGPGRDRAMAVLGGDTLTVDVDDDATVNAAAHSSDLGALRISVHGNCVLQLGGQFEDVDFTKSPAAMVTGTTIKMAELRYEDASMLDRVIGLAASANGQTPEQLRAVLHERIAGLARLLPDQPDAAAVLDRFIDHPGTLTITMHPPVPVAISGVMQTPAKDQATVLGVRISDAK